MEQPNNQQENPKSAEQLLAEVQAGLVAEGEDRAILVKDAVTSITSMTEGNIQLDKRTLAAHSDDKSREMTEGYKIDMQLLALRKTESDLMESRRLANIKRSEIRKQTQKLLETPELPVDKQTALQAVLTKIAEEEAIMEDEVNKQKADIENKREELGKTKEEWNTKNHVIEVAKHAARTNPLKFATDTVIEASKLSPDPKANLSELRPQIEVSLGIESFLSEKQKKYEALKAKLKEIETRVKEGEDCHIASAQKIENELYSTENTKKINELKSIINSKKRFWERAESYEEKKAAASKELDSLLKDFKDRSLAVNTINNNTQNEPYLWFINNDLAIYYTHEFDIKSDQAKKHLPELGSLVEKIETSRREAQSIESDFNRVKSQLQKSVSARMDRTNELIKKIDLVFLGR